MVILIVLVGMFVLAIPTVGVLAAIAIPNFMEMQYRAKRAELPANVDGIKAAQMGYYAAFGTYVPCGSAEEAEAALLSVSGKAQRPWIGGDCWDTLGWQPDGMVRGFYWVEVAEDGSDFAVWAIGDIDGDGDPAVYSATSIEPTTFHKSNGVY